MTIRSLALAGLAIGWRATRRLRREDSLRIAITVDRPLEEVQLRLQSLPRPRGELSLAPAPGGRGTQLHLSTSGSRIAAKIELHHLKELLEVGEIVHSDASIHAGPHPAQPSV
jgi:hypothetical protein